MNYPVASFGEYNPESLKIHSIFPLPLGSGNLYSLDAEDQGFDFGIDIIYGLSG